MSQLKFGSETRLIGLPISPGMAFSRVCLLRDRGHEGLSVRRIAADGVRYEQARLRRAVELAIERLGELSAQVAVRIGASEAAIFDVQRMMLSDAALSREMDTVIANDRLNAEAAVARTLDSYEARLRALDDPYLRERATDISEIRRRVLDNLVNMGSSLHCWTQEHCQRGTNRIIVAEELTPGLTIELDTEHVMGFVSERGGPTSHAAILARALGIPAVSGIRDVRGLFSCGTELLLDGNTGEVIVWPSERTLAGHHCVPNLRPVPPQAVAPVQGLTVMANISRADELADALDMQAEGIGLYRTEFEFLAAERVLDEEEQAAAYTSVVRGMDGRPVYFRLLDIGGDKEAPFFNLQREDNPYLGLRGSRLLLARPDLVVPQARALARASVHGPVHVIYPMIVEVEQFLRLRRLFVEAIGDIPAGSIFHGVMFEVPAACLQAREMLEVADFGSIGTNDLIQYLFAVDRNNERVAYDCSPDRTVFWSLIRRIVEAAEQTGRSLSVCGELAGDPRYLARLREIGIRTVSVAPRLIPVLRRSLVQPCT
ncbi:MAG: phosphoenolpyruvate--protein phosphotransferase [Phycisphaerae bacterium]